MRTSVGNSRAPRPMALAALILVGAALTAGAAVPASGAERLELGLQGAIDLGLKNDQMLRQAAEGVAGAEAQVLEARANALPHLAISGQYGRNLLRPSFFLPAEFFGEGTGSVKIQIGESNDFQAAATVTQVLWAAGRVSAGLEAAKEYLSLFRYREKAAADYVRFSVKEAYYGVLLAAELLRIEEKASEAVEEAARIARAGFDQGVVSRYDRLRADVEVANRAAPLVKARNDYEQAAMILRRLCGIDATIEIALADSLDAVPDPAAVDSFLALMRESSPELQALRHSIGAQEQFLRLAKATRYPVVNLQAYYAWNTQWSNDYLPPDDLLAESAAVQLGFQIPIFDGFDAKGKIGRAKADLRVAELELERATLDRDLSVRRSYRLLENAITALDGREESVALAEETYRIALVRLTNGLATPIERLDAELAMTTARAQLVEALYASRLAEAYLELSVGGEAYNAYMKGR